MQYKLWAWCESFRVGMQQTSPIKYYSRFYLEFDCYEKKRNTSLLLVPAPPHLWAKSYFRSLSRKQNTCLWEMNRNTEVIHTLSLQASALQSHWCLHVNRVSNAKWARLYIYFPTEKRSDYERLQPSVFLLNETNWDRPQVPRPPSRPQ